MGAVTCPYCGGPHPLWECRKAPQGWRPSAPPNPAPSRPPTVKAVAKASATALDPKAVRKKPMPAPAVAETAKRGRPRTGFDKGAYNREYMRDKRAEEKAARLKAEKEGKS